MSKKNFKAGFDSLLGGNIEVSQRAPLLPDKQKNIETRATFILNADILEKIKAISYWERKLLKTVLHEALEEYVKEYQKNKGDIKLRNTM